MSQLTTDQAILAALAAAYEAVGGAPAAGALAAGYVIGQLGGLVPTPGGVGGTDGAWSPRWCCTGRRSQPPLLRSCSTGSSSWACRRCSEPRRRQLRSAGPAPP